MSHLIEIREKVNIINELVRMYGVSFEYRYRLGISSPQSNLLNLHPNIEDNKYKKITDYLEYNKNKKNLTEKDVQDFRGEIQNLRIEELRFLVDFFNWANNGF